MSSIPSSTKRCLTLTAAAAVALFSVAPVSSATSVSALGTSGGTTVCEIGTCPDPDSTNIVYGQTAGGQINFTYTFANGDQYKVTGFFSNSYGANGSQLDFAPNPTYIGNNGNSSVAAVGTDVLSLTMFQNIYDNTPGSWDGTYCEQFPVDVPSGVSASAAVSYYGQSVGTLSETGPYTNPANPPSLCKSLTLPSAQATSDYLETAYNLTFTFNQGTTSGTGATTPTPEPASALSLLFGCSTLAAVVARRRRRS